MRRQKGFATLELGLIIIGLILVGFIAWRLVKTGEPAATVDQSTVVSDSAVPEVTQTSDLDKLETQLNDTSIEDDTATQLDAESTF